MPDDDSQTPPPPPPPPLPLTVTVRMRQSASMGRRPRDTAAVETHKHVPGSVLRGALAAVWIREHGPPQRATADRRAEFVRLFEGPVRYGPLFDPVSAVVPLSVYRCKYQPEPECVAEHIDQADPAQHTAADRPRCQRCEGRMEAGRGEVTFFGTGDGVVSSTRVKLDETERAAEGQLFTRRSLGHRIADGVFRELTGSIVTPADDRTPWLLAERGLRIGGDRSTAGAADYLARRPDDPTALPDPGALVTDGTLVVRLTSPAILLDAAGRPTDRPDEKRLGELLGVHTRVRRGWLRRERVSGWNALANLPKPEESAVSAGSVFQLRLAGTPTGEGLARLRDHGLGVRGSEGFGWLELGRWALPGIAKPVPPQQREDLHSGLARRLDETGRGAWFLARLRECALDLRRGAPANRRFLDLPTAEILDQYGNLRRLVEMLLGKEASDIEGVYLHLEARVRGVRR